MISLGSVIAQPMNFVPDIIASASDRSYNGNDLLVFLFTVIFVSILSGIVVYVIYCFFLMKLFAKANVPAWKAWVPFANIWKFFELGGYQGALSLLFLASIIPFVGWIGNIVGLVFFYMAAYQIGLKNGKEGYWVVLCIFLGIVWVGILGLGKSVWNDSLGKRSLGSERPPSWPPYGGGYSSGWQAPQGGSYPYQ